jgi:protein subunit release factor A
MAEEKNTLLSKLDELQRRCSEIEKQIADPETIRDPAKLTLLSKEQGKLKPIADKYG